MKKAAAFLGVLCFVIALVFPTLATREFLGLQSYYFRAERCFGPPVQAPRGKLFLRQDSCGKGFFGASRNGNRTHKGIDFLAAVGDPISAAKSGRVAVSRTDRGYGQYIELRHPDGSKSRYAHLSRLFVAEGEWVTAGQLIGACGKTGNAGDPRMKAHLHFETLSPGGALNPSGVLDSRLTIQKT